MAVVYVFSCVVITFVNIASFLHLKPFLFRYLIGRSRFHSPLLLLCGVKLSSLTDNDYDIIDEVAERMLSFRNVK